MQDNSNRLTGSNLRKIGFCTVKNDPMIHSESADPQSQTVCGDRLVDVFNPVPALRGGGLFAPTRNVTQAGGKIGLMASLQNHDALLDDEAVADEEMLDGMVPINAPAIIFGGTVLVDGLPILRQDFKTEFGFVSVRRHKSGGKCQGEHCARPDC